MERVREEWQIFLKEIEDDTNRLLAGVEEINRRRLLHGVLLGIIGEAVVFFACLYWWLHS